MRVKFVHWTGETHENEVGSLPRAGDSVKVRAGEASYPIISVTHVLTPAYHVIIGLGRPYVGINPHREEPPKEMAW